MIGHNVSHAKNRTRKIFKPNLHSAKVMVNGVSKKMRLCTKCLRLLKKKVLPVAPVVEEIKEVVSAPAL